MPPRLLLALLLTSLVAAPSPATVSRNTGARPWPLLIDVNLSSSFGEYRSGHLHAGVDIKTNGRIGYACQAVGNGYVSRLRASPNGYGRAIYLTLDTGETCVYAHLAEFAPELEVALHAEQRKADSYTVDVYYDEPRFTFRQGDIVGYTGTSGTTAPHLHFEVRDDRQNPMNPLSLGWKLEDHSAPAMARALWIPLSPDTRINGRCRPREIDLRPAGPAHYAAGDTVLVNGRAGLGVQVVDRLNPTSGRLAPYSLELTVDGVLLASMVLESFTYSHTGEVVLAYEMAHVRSMKRQYLLLFKRPGETLWHRTFVNDGIIDSELIRTLVGSNRAAYTIVIRASDRAGNVSTATIPFAVRGRARAEEPVPTPIYAFDNLVSIDRAAADFGVEIAGRFEPYRIGPLAAGSPAGYGAYTGEDLRRHFEMSLVASSNPTSNVVQRVVAPRRKDAPRRYIVPLRAGVRDSCAIEPIGIEVVSDAGSLYGDAVAYAGRWNRQTQIVDRRVFDVVARPVEVGPLSLALHRPIELRFARGAGDIDERAAVYSFDDDKGEWSFEPSEIDSSAVVGWVRNPGVFAVLIDHEEPVIRQPRAAHRRSFATGEITHQIVIEIEDSGSGVDVDRTEVRVDGKKQIAEWVVSESSMFVPVETDDGVSHRVSVVARDRAGNASTLESRITLRN